MVPAGRPGVVRLWTTKPPELAPYGVGELIEVGGRAGEGRGGEESGGRGGEGRGRDGTEEGRDGGTGGR